MDFQFYVDIENSSGTRFGGGPLTGVSRWEYTARMSKAGTFRFTIPATDPQATIIRKKRVARAYALLNNTWTEVGAGIIDSIVRRVQPDGTVLLEVSGSDLLRELNYRSVKDLKLYFGNAPVSHATALTAVSAFAPAGWTFTADPAPPNNSIYGRFNGETVLAALVKIAEKSQNQFYRGSGRSVIFTSTFSSSGIRAIQAGPGALSAETCAITNLTVTEDSHDLITRIYPRGSGNGDIQLTLKHTTRTAPSGYTLNTANNYIESNAAVSTYGVIEQFVDFKEIGPIENTASDIQAAANMLFDAALEELKRRAIESDTPYYTLSLAQCGVLLRPMQTLVVDYFDPDAGLDIAESLNILEATWRVDDSGIQTTGVVVTTADRWPTSEASTVAESIAQGRLYQAHPQLNANSYVTAYTKNVDADGIAAFRFRFGDEVVQLQSVFFEFQLLPFESTVRAVAVESMTGGSGELVTDPAVGNSGAPSNNTSGTPSTNTSGAPSNNTSGAPSVTNTGAASGNTGPASGNTGAASGSTGPASGNTGGSGTLTTGAPDGGDIVSGGRHNHGLGIVGSTTFDSNNYKTLYYDQANNRIVAYSLGFNPGVLSTNSGDHTHDIDPHTHDLNSHTHSLNDHTHSLNNHTHDLGNHTHSLGGHTHSLNNHTHSLNNHTHDLGNHTHSLNNHTHTVKPVIEAVYGIFRETAANTYSINHLEYRVNGGSWTALSDDATDLGGGWYRLDITAAVQDANTLRPAQESNLLEIRGALSSGLQRIEGNGVTLQFLLLNVDLLIQLQIGNRVRITGTANYNGEYVITAIIGSFVQCASAISGPAELLTGTATLLKTATIDAQLAVRNIIQAIALT